jgi:hypothetical protein
LKVENLFLKQIRLKLTSPVELSSLQFSKSKNPKFFKLELPVTEEFFFSLTKSPMTGLWSA